MKTITLALLALAACTDDEVVPETPTYQADIAPILNARCVRCHGYPALAIAKPEMRLDRFETLGDVSGVQDNAFAIALRVRGLGGGDDGLGPRAQMPPRFPLTDSQIETVVRWADQGAERGAPRPGNRPPELRIGLAGGGGVFEVDYELTDPDGDLVTGGVYTTFRLGTDEFTELLLDLSSGRETGRNITLPMRPALTRYTIFARIDDGAGDLEIPIKEVTL